MERYKESLCHNIIDSQHKTIQELDDAMKYNDDFETNRNEEGKLHSKYLGDSYEPAIIYYADEMETRVYLFDGDIKDCIHPTIVTYFEETIVFVEYYSTERIENGEPIYLSEKYTLYNSYFYKGYETEWTKLLPEYKAKKVNKNMLNSFSLLCNEMIEPVFKFKFAD